MTQTYRFLGTMSTIGDIGLNEYGQKVELEPEHAFVVMQRVALLEDSEFKKIGMSEQELLDYKYVGSHEEATDEFKAKKQAALMKYFELRDAVIAPADPKSTGGKA